MKILQVVTLFTSNGEYGGPIRVAENQSAYLASAGHEVLIVGGRKNQYRQHSDEYIGEVSVRTFQSIKLLPSAGFRFYTSLSFLWWFWKNCRMYDVVHVHLARDLTSAPAALIALMRKRHVVVQPHGMIIQDRRVAARCFDYFFTKRILRNAGAIFYLTDIERSELECIAGAPSRLVELRNGVAQTGEPRQSSQEASGSAIEVLFVARLHARKRPLLLVEAATHLLEHGVEAKYTLIGPDQGEGLAVGAAIANSGYEACIRWDGQLESNRILDRMRMSDIFVLPSIDEPYPMVVLEAMSIGLPVIITDSCGLSEMVKTSGSGIVVDSSKGALERAIKRLVEDHDLRAELGRNARAAVAQHASIATVGEKLCENYLHSDRPSIADEQMKNMRITIIGINFDPEITGIGPYTTGMADALVNRAFDVTVITAYPHYPDPDLYKHINIQAQSELHGGHYIVKRRRHFRFESNGIVARFATEVSFGLSAAVTGWNSPDIVILVSPAMISCIILRMSLRVHGLRSKVGVWVQDFYGAAVKETNAGPSVVAKLVSQIELALLKSADGIAVIHQSAAETLGGLLGGTNTAVIRNWARHSEVTFADISLANVRKKLGWQKRYVALHAGNMGAKQDLLNIVNAAKIASNLRDESLLFVLLGAGNQCERLINEAAHLDNIKIIPPLPEKEFRLALAASDVLLLNETPGLSETAVPSKLTSYFSAGRPIVAATEKISPAANEILRARAGIRVDPGDPEALLEAINALRRDGELASQYGVSGKSYSRLALDKETSVKGFVSWMGRL